ncbi:MAG: GNAT family N-acetyltransferase [Bdellovibrionota bacterium]
MIRKIRESDAAVVFETIRAHAGNLGSPKWNEAQVLEECRGPGFVSEDAHGSVCAFILFHESVSAREITYLATAIGALRQGVMKHLLSHLIEESPAGLPVWLEVHELNEAARRLYINAGFTIVGRREKYYADGAAAILYTRG